MTNALLRLLDYANKHDLRKTAKQASHVHADSIPGNGATPNEDACIAFSNSADVLILADGVGGSAFGNIASRIAVDTAAQSVLAGLDKGIGFLDVLEQAFARAATAVREASEEVGRDMRTTLIIVLGGTKVFAYGYLGDGMLLHLGSDGVSSLLKPMREGNPPLLTGSLGHVQEGTPVLEVAARASEDLIIAATDGIGDLVDNHDCFAQDIRNERSRKGDLAQSIGTILDVLSKAQDDSGLIAHDNLTLGVITERKP